MGFLVSNRGIEANPEKIKAITSLAKPACINDVQRLEGRVAALSRFISRLGEKALPLYQMMKKTDTFLWSDAANTAFEDLKRQLSEPRSLRLPLIKSRCCYMWLLIHEPSVLPSWWSVRRQARSIRFNGRFTTSVRCSLSLNKGIHIGRNLFTECLWHAGS